MKVEKVIARAQAFNGYLEKESKANLTEFIKNAGDENLKEVFVEVANCYFLDGKKDVAVKYIKKAITKYGFTEDEFIYSTTLNQDLSEYALSKVYDDYFALRKQYLATLK